ncbi:hypothetical protein PI126_g3072 [Phytophthora idaei]|nr:hypothetical protein PI126_g3072 [Phytophthora idaei]
MGFNGETDEVLLLTAVQFVTRECLHARGIELEHVSRAIDDYVNELPRDWSLEDAYKKTGSLRCMQYVAAREPEMLPISYQAWVANNIAEMTVRREDVQALKWLAERYSPDTSTTKAAVVAAREGRLDVLQWLHQSHHSRVHWGGDEWCEAVRGGHKDVVEWLHLHVKPHTDAAPQLIRDAARAGDLQLVQWLHGNYNLQLSNALVEAEKGRQWGVVKWILSNSDVETPSVDMIAIAADGNIHFLQWVYTQGVGSPTSHTLEVADFNGYLSILQWLHDGPTKLVLSAATFREAARGGQLEVLKWLHERQCLATSAAIEAAAENGFLKVVQWLYANRKEICTSRALDRAARNGHLDVVKWLHETGESFYCPAAINRAAEFGHLDVVKWLHANRTEGCSTEALDLPLEAQLPHVAQRIDSFLDRARSWTLSDVYECTSSLHCMRLLEDRRPAVESLYREWEFNAVVAQAAKSGDLTSLAWLADSYMLDGTLSSAAQAAAASGQLPVLKWLLEKHKARVHWGGLEWYEAIREGQTHVIEWLHQHATPNEDAVWRLVLDVATRGDLELVQCGWRQCDALPPTDCVDAAVKDGDLEFLKWVHANKLVDSLSGAVPISAASGHLDVLRWLYEEGGERELTADCMDQAASAGHLDVVKWLDSHECPATTLAMDGAASAGFIDVVKWLHDQRTEGCSVSAMNGAAENGYFEVVKWLHSNRDEGCGVSAMEKAAGNGHLDIVEWLHSHRNEGCTERAMDWAAKEGHLEVVKWLHMNRSEGCTTAAMDWAAYGGHLKTMKWLDENRSEGRTPKALCLAAAGGHLDVLKWLHSTKSERLTSDAADMVAAGGHLQVLEWLHANGADECAPSAMRDAVLGHHVPVILFLLKNYQHDICEEGICFLRDEWEDLEVRFVGLTQWLLEQFGGALEGASFSVNRADWATNKWMIDHNVQHLDVEAGFVYWECGPVYL